MINSLRVLRDRQDPVLWISMILAMAITLIGANWGVYEAWNPDQVAFHCLTCVENQPLNPGWFLKPPFFSYLVLFFARLPAGLIEDALSLDHSTGLMLALLLARLLNALLFALTCAVGYAILKPVAGLWPARLFAILLGTSAGFDAYAHFLTTEISVTFFMLAAFWFCARILRGPRLADYILAGLLVGIATATKYNGLAVGIAIPIAHFLTSKPHTLGDYISTAFDKRLMLGLAAIVIGFLFANPYALIDYTKFTGDFYYNYVTIPVYSGTNLSHSYYVFLASLVEIFGWPLCIFIAAALPLIAYAWARGRLTQDQRNLIILALGTFLLYFYKFGAFPRFETRFALPAAPLLLLVAMIPLRNIDYQKLLPFAVPIGAYGMVCGIFVGLQFLSDPRMDAYDWADELPANTRIEVTTYIPNFKRSPDFAAKLERIPIISGRSRVFAELAEDLDIEASLQRHEGEEHIEWYTKKALHERRPDYIAVNSIYYDRYFHTAKADFYPELKEFYTQLLNEEFCYRTVLDEHSPGIPSWVYPQKIDFLENRMIIQKVDNECLEAGS